MEEVMNGNKNEAYERARSRVKAIKGFYSHLFFYILVNLFLIILNHVTTPGFCWFYWPLLGWGFGLVCHGVSVFGLSGFLGEEWEERKIKKIMEKEKRDE